MKHREAIEPLILHIRDQKIILDSDLAQLYGVATRGSEPGGEAQCEAISGGFHVPDFRSEWRNLKSQFVTSSPAVPAKDAPAQNWPQIAIGSHGGRRKLPFAFTEHGTLMAATVLNSSRAVQMSQYIIRAFVKMREELTANATILKRLAEINKSIFLHDSALRDIYQKLRPLLAPPPEKPRRRIGFNRDAE